MKSNQITIKGQPYRIIFQDHIGSSGLNFPGEKVIVVDKSMAKEDQVDALVHELLHGLFQENSWDRALSSLAMEETMVYELTRFFFTVHKALKSFEKAIK